MRVLSFERLSERLALGASLEVEPADGQQFDVGRVCPAP